MSKIAVIYWSGTGNTEAMADLVANAAAAAGASVDKFTASEFNVSSAGDYTGFALGCPAMGAEQLEEDEVEPMFAGLEGSLGGKKIALFGSYGWGDGQWMREWCSRCEAAG
uniref:flavodoxin domain-containing protein n=1 Tax=Gemmiger formicilis TaxID=745368 RepID=UPI003FEE2A56